MNYVFLVYGDAAAEAALSAEQRAALERAGRLNNRALRESGHLWAEQHLQPRDAALAVRLAQGCIEMSDAMSRASDIACASRDTLIALCFIKARDLNEALHIAAHMPQAHIGTIEVWPTLAEA